MKSARTLLVLTVFTLVVSFISTQPSFAGDEYCNRCNRCECENETAFEKVKKKCCCCCSMNLAEPPRGLMSFSVPAVPVAQIAAPVPQIQLQLQQQKSPNTFAAEQNEQFLKDLKALLEGSETQALAQPEKTVEQRLTDLENNMQKLAESVGQLSDVTRVLAEELKKEKK